MRLRLAVALAAIATFAAGCDSGGGETAATSAETAAPASSLPAAPPAPSPSATPPPAPASAALPGLSAPFATQAEWVSACTTQAGIDASICDCVVKATSKELGDQAFYTWVWEGYVKREGMGQVRSRKWFTDNNIDKARQQKFADEVGKCYVTQ